MISTVSQPAATAASSASSSGRSEKSARKRPIFMRARTSSRRTGRRSSVERASAKMTREAAAGCRPPSTPAAHRRAIARRSSARTPSRSTARNDGQRDPAGALAVAAEPRRFRAARRRRPRPGGAAALADELPVAVPRRLDVRLGPRALVGDRRAVVERQQRRHGRVVLRRARRGRSSRARRPRPPPAR